MESASTERNRSPKPVILVITVFLVLLLGSFAWLSSPFWMPEWDNYKHRLAFESKVWKASSKDDGIMWPTRLRMVDDLLASGVLKNKTHAEVITLLGTDQNSPTELTYRLGPERGFLGIDSEWLTIEFDPQGRVKNWRVWTD